MDGYRLRLSLFLRMGIAVSILAAVSLVVAVIIGILGGVLGLTAWDWILGGLVALATLPSLSDVTPAEAVHVAVIAALGLYFILDWWSTIARHTSATSLLQPTPVSLLATGWALGCLYLLAVEGSAAIVTAVETASAVGQLLLVFGLSGLLTVVVMVAESRREIRRLRERLVDDSVPAAETAPELEATVARLAQLAAVPTPGVYVTETDRAESFTLGNGETAAIVVSSGLQETLSAAELEAVLAHEVSHLANWDSRLMSAAIVPVLIAEDWIDERPDDVGDRFWNALFRLLKRVSQFGVAVLSRGREFHADAGAAALLGSPAALASALETLAEERRTPTTDLREWEQTVVALDILPPAADDRVSGPFRTHPPTEDRIARLRQLAAE
ncbi:M48 family metallopeptidase [Natrialbaceae archaeon AArc-T1-2]|uniref:M48 family metallopeptidase n=1 Tax=Natrialbaceae archaeon AArc-T1-2 TaxID=3053904 RepID=UPI00255ADA72|nr:M48 family metalloprotease [Natrialbaceae archaeon AArc-T1-2]WIV68602.1 M48 family metalloprotease [Natrialbaceae archaeon AArc-T1-2]